MEDAFDTLYEQWDGEAVVTRYDAPTGSWIFIALHDTALGTPSGGTRMRVYPSPTDGLRDAMSLAEAMTHKWAGLGLDQGGGKAVIALSKPLSGPERTGLLRRYGALLRSLNGAFNTGEDLGTSPQDMAIVGELAPWVHGLSRNGEDPVDSGPYTALGVFNGIRAALERVFGSPDLTGRVVLIQGVGDVGAPLAEQLAAQGARLLVSDVDRDRAAALARRLEAREVEPEAVYETPCDVFSPCAIGAILSEETIPRLACRAVVGSANCQLARPEDAARLRDRGILYGPDFIVNAGGALAFALEGRGVRDPRVLTARVSEIGQTLREIFSAAEASGDTPLEAANRRVAERLAGARTG